MKPSRASANYAPSPLNGVRAGVRGGTAHDYQNDAARQDHPSPSIPFPVEGRGRRVSVCNLVSSAPWDSKLLKRFRQTRAGFTIIEVMLAIGIFSMILVSIYSVWVGILKASKVARTAADNAQRARISMRAIGDALTTAQMFTANMPPQNQHAYYAFVADMSGDFGSLSFVAHLPANFPGVGHFDHVVRRVTFTIEPDKDGGLDLVMRQGPMLNAAEKDYEPYTLVLAKDVQLFGFEFWGQERGEWKWIDHWDSTNSLPALVHVGLGLGKTAKRGEAQDVVHRYIALPATAVQPDWQMPIGIGGGPRRPGQPNQPGQPNPNQPGSGNPFPGGPVPKGNYRQ